MSASSEDEEGASTGESKPAAAKGRPRKTTPTKK